MINIHKLKDKIVQSGFSIEEVAEKVGINRATFYRKMNRKDFYVNEANSIVKLLNLSCEDAMAIFFANIVA